MSDSNAPNVSPAIMPPNGKARIGLRRHENGRLYLTREDSGEWILQCEATAGLFKGYPLCRVLAPYYPYGASVAQTA